MKNSDRYDRIESYFEKDSPEIKYINSLVTFKISKSEIVKQAIKDFCQNRGGLKKDASINLPDMRAWNKMLWDLDACEVDEIVKYINRMKKDAEIILKVMYRQPLEVGEY